MIYLQSELPCIEYLQKVMHIFAYLKVHTHSESVFDPSENYFDKSEFPSKDWTHSIHHSE